MHKAIIIIALTAQTVFARGHSPGQGHLAFGHPTKGGNKIGAGISSSIGPGHFAVSPNHGELRVPSRSMNYGKVHYSNHENWSVPGLAKPMTDPKGKLFGFIKGQRN